MVDEGEGIRGCFDGGAWGGGGLKKKEVWCLGSEKVRRENGRMWRRVNRKWPLVELVGVVVLAMLDDFLFRNLRVLLSVCDGASV